MSRNIISSPKFWIYLTFELIKTSFSIAILLTIIGIYLIYIKAHTQEILELGLLWTLAFIWAIPGLSYYFMIKQLGSRKKDMDAEKTHLIAQAYKTGYEQATFFADSLKGGLKVGRKKL